MRGAVLAGGASSRFGGRPKGLERVGGERILDRVAAAVAAATGAPPFVIANVPEAKNWRPDLEVIGDRGPERGTLAGIYTAVCAGSGPVLVTAWDMPFLTPDLLRSLIGSAPGFDVFLPESRGPRGVEPLCGVYAPACVPAIRGALARGDLSAVGFHSAVRTGTLPLAEVERHGPADRLFFNLNEPADLERAEALCHPAIS